MPPGVRLAAGGDESTATGDKLACGALTGGATTPGAEMTPGVRLLAGGGEFIAKGGELAWGALTGGGLPTGGAEVTGCVLAAGAVAMPVTTGLGGELAAGCAGTVVLTGWVPGVAIENCPGGEGGGGGKLDWLPGGGDVGLGLGLCPGLGLAAGVAAAGDCKGLAGGGLGSLAPATGAVAPGAGTGACRRCAGARTGTGTGTGTERAGACGALPQVGWDETW